MNPLLRRAATLLSVAALLGGCDPGDGGAVGSDPRVTALEAGPIPRRPNIVLVTVDTLRADRTSAYGHDRPTTPNLARVAAEGALFEAAYSAMPTTLPAHAVLFTSRHPNELGLHRNGTPVGPEAETLAEQLGAAGYATAAFVSSYVVHSKFGLAQGFEHYDDDFVGADNELPAGTRWDNQVIDVPFDRRGRHTTDRAIHWLAQRRDPRPLLLWVHYFDPHQPLRPMEPYRSEFARPEATREREVILDHYDAEVRYTDEQLGRLLAAVEAVAPGSQTLTVVTSDHGEGLYDHGWLEHGVDLYEEAGRVPWVMRWPGRIEKGLRIPSPVGLVDALPTLLGLLDFPAPASLRGTDWSDVLTGNAAPAVNQRVFLQRRRYSSTRIAHRHVAGQGIAIRWRDWKLIRTPRERGLELFHLGRDPDERENVAGLHPDITRSLNAEIDTWLADQTAPPENNAPLPDDVSEALRALGYAD